MPNIPNFRWRAAVKKDDPKTGEVFIYSVIDDTKWDPDDVTPASFKTDLDKLGDIKQLNIYINSPGGSPFAAHAIYNIINRAKKNMKVTTYNDGLAASAASIILMSGDKIVIPVNALTMIHRAWTIAIGNANDFRKLANDLDIIDNTLVNIYQTKNKALSREDIISLLDAETWMTAQDALDYGFEIEIGEEKQVAASIQGFDIKSLKYQNLPIEKLIEIYNGVIPDDVSREKAPEDEQWTKPALSDFTDQQWKDLSDAEKRRIAGHFAWADASPATTFGDLKLGHHRPSDGAVVWNGVANAAARLDQTDVPEEDKPDIRAHLGSHYRQFGKTPPWEKEQNKIKNPPKAETKPEENPANNRVFDLEKHLPKINQLIERRKNHERKA